jgi:phthalate 4,5-dioxygenase
MNKREEVCTTKEENELLTKVGPGTAMGELFRQYQIPVLLSAELESGGPPKRVRLLGEDLVAFRTTRGQIGLVGESCSHRCASLYFGRIEEEGIRCIYHGWKYGLGGQCLDMPNVPAEYQFKEKIRHPAYPCVDRGGFIWTYMGFSKEPPPIPDFEFLSVPEEHRYIEQRDYQNCSYLQALEGGIDPSHGAFLHGPIQALPLADDGALRAHGTGIGADRDVGGTMRIGFATGQRTPVVEMVETEYGVIVSGRRNAPEPGKYLWRINHFLMPFYTMPPGTSDLPYLCHMWVPVDDEHHINWRPQWSPFRPLRDEERRRFVYERLPATPEAYGDIRLAANRSNNYFMDWEIHRTRKFGIPTLHLEDVAVTESQGPICDRTKQNLTQADIASIAVYDRLMSAAAALANHQTPPAGAYDPTIYRGVRGACAALPKDASWVEYLKAQRVEVVARS